MRAEEMQKMLMEDDGGFIAVNKNLIASLGLNEAILYTELVSKLNYYQENDMAVDEFYCTYDDLYISTGILKTAQQTALKNLENFGLIKINLKGMPRKRYIRILDAKEKIIEYLEEGQKKIDELIKQSKEKSNILKEKIAESLNNKQLAEISQQESRNLLTSNQKSANKKAEISEQESRNLLTSNQKSANKFAEICQQVSRNLLTSSQKSAINNNRIIILDNNNKEIIKDNNNINNNNINNNNISYNRENVNNNTKEENNFINSLLVAKEENNSNSSLVTKEENNYNSSLVVGNNLSLIQKDMIIDYYFQQYKNIYNKLHDKIDKEKIYSKIDNFSLSYNINSEMWIELIDYHFSLSSLKTDGSIYHFLSDNIIKNYLDKINKLNNFSVVDTVDTKENNLKYAYIDDNIKEILQYFVDKYYSYFGINYWEKEDFYVSDIKQYAELIELLSSDFGLEVTLDCWKKKIDAFFELDKYDKTLNTFLQFTVINDMITERMTNSEYYEAQQEYDDVELPF